MIRHSFALAFLALVAFVLSTRMCRGTERDSSGLDVQRFYKVHVSTYAKKFTDSARAHGNKNRRYNPDACVCAVGWRFLRGSDLLLFVHGWELGVGGDDDVAVPLIYAIKAHATDCMEKKFDVATSLYLDCSPALMRKLGMKSAGWIDSVWVFNYH